MRRTSEIVTGFTMASLLAGGSVLSVFYALSFLIRNRWFWAMVILCITTTASHASTWIQVGGVSLHDKSDRNHSNPGLGIQQDIDERSFFAFGRYKNSYFDYSHYLIYGRRLFVRKVISAGVFVGTVDGYWNINNGNFTFIAAPFVSVNWKSLGSDLVLIPPQEKDGTATLSLQFKVRVQ